MTSTDTETLDYQNSQKLFHERGYIHRNDPGDYVGRTDKPSVRQKSCKLSREQMLALKNYMIPHIKSPKSTLADVFSKIPVELIADEDGIVMTEMTFRRMYSRFKTEVLTTTEDVKTKVIALKNAGLSADEICEKLRNIMRPQYLRPILEECGFGSQKSKAQIARELLAQGMNYVAINKKHPEISVKYARELDALDKKKAKNESE
jgi:hypothetical protein